VDWGDGGSHADAGLETESEDRSIRLSEAPFSFVGVLYPESASLFSAPAPLSAFAVLDGSPSPSGRKNRRTARAPDNDWPDGTRCVDPCGQDA